LPLHYIFQLKSTIRVQSIFYDFQGTAGERGEQGPPGMHGFQVLDQ